MIITSGGIAIVRLDPEFDYHNAVNQLRRSEITGMPAEAEKNRLYNNLVKPVLQHIPTHIREMIIVPDITLNHLPFNILRENTAGRELGEIFNIAISPSVSASILASETGQRIIFP